MALEEGKKIQIYSSNTSSSGRLVTPFWKEKYERDAKKYWDVFYRRHQDKFFKDRHYLDKEWGHYFEAEDGEKLVVLEVGCGVGNTIFPLLSLYPSIFIHACDFSPRAIDLVKQHKDYSENHINAFVCDITADDLSNVIEPSSIDILTMIFVLSAVSPEKMILVLQNIRRVLSQNGRVLFRDYASGDLAQERLTSKGQQISENFYVRGDGTRAYYFSEEFLTNLFEENGFQVLEIGIHNKQVENRSLELVMNRSWIQAVFTTRPAIYNLVGENGNNKEENTGDIQFSKVSLVEADDNDVDISEDIDNLFGISHTAYEVIKIQVKGNPFKIKALSREYQHTCKSTGLMLWESARLMCNLLAYNSSICTGKRVLELGTGSAGVCSMVASDTAEIVVATDGDVESLELLKENISSNLHPKNADKVLIRKLFWGDKGDINAIKENVSSFDVIIGTDVTYNPEATIPLFETAREFIADRENGRQGPYFILCHIQRRVDEASILSAARLKSFELVDRWFNGVDAGNGIIDSWFLGRADFIKSDVQNASLSILLFQPVVRE
ncbi:Methyltransferase family protein [Rhynchospora pubera]|uniref:Methyltransferase family protein n=1 Tax=Rhynchospora pubera TaxID=906938 RepID=A0AAV8GG94_9POAL|nr:Methyltransferase family protein [Rhynchospora pubera]